MRIVDTYNEIQAAFLQKEWSLSRWREYADSISTSVREKVEDDAKDYDFASQVAPVIQSALSNRSKLEETHESFLLATQQLNDRFFNVFQCEVEVDIVLYLGLCNGAGWATSIDGRMTVLLGMEKIIELDWCDARSMASLLYHEVTHIWHDAVRNECLNIDRQSDKSIWQLYREGVAMYGEQLLCNDLSYYHQDDGEWLSWCIKNKDALFQEYRRRVEENESTQDFFGDWCTYQGHSDVGYYLGCEFIKHLLPKYSLTEIAKLTIDALTKEWSDYE
ncbi:hypothetical protein [Gorillibacterium sp. CAU 1737]|uniref:hypothetical protein n=1 Tax=Gorillibacterium sp. CAU 1737 TaxID=3140362 RepID=UPI0032618209